MIPLAIRKLLEGDRWTVAKGTAEIGPYIIRYREPVLEPAGAPDFGHCLRIVWSYAPEGSGLLPDTSTTEQMQAFEATVLDAVERDVSGVLTAVVTFDGARQWVLYTRASESAAVVNSVLQHSKPLPLEMNIFADPEWEYLRHEVLLRVKGDSG